MPLLDSTLSLIAFKHLQGKSMTDTNKGVGNEAEGIKLNVDAGVVFINEIDSDPSVAVLMGVAEFVTANLTLDPTSNNQAYFATYPIGHPLAGQRIKNAISPTYGDGYEAKPFAGVNPIPVNDPIDWIYQYQSGIFYFQDPGSLGGTPTTIQLYVYVGELLSDIVGSIQLNEPDWNTTTADDLQMIPAGNVLPFSNDVNDLGSETLRWKDLYLGSKIDASTILEFVTAGNTRIYIDASGNVGIGTVPSGGYILDVNGSTRITGDLEINGNVLAKYTIQPDTQSGFDDLSIPTKKYVDDLVGGGGTGSGGTIPVDVTGTNNYIGATVTGYGPITGYDQSIIYLVTFVNDNTAPSTIDIDGVGAFDIFKGDPDLGLVPLEAGDIVASISYYLIFDGVQFQIFDINPESTPGTYTNLNPSTIAVGGIPVGTTFNAMTYTALFNMMFYPYTLPTFTAFAITGQSTILEVGQSISAGVKTFTWNTTNPVNININTIKIRDITSSGSPYLATDTKATQTSGLLVAGRAYTILNYNSGDIFTNVGAGSNATGVRFLASGTTPANWTNGSQLGYDDNTENITFPSAITKTVAATHIWRIYATRTNSSVFTRDFSVSWRYRIFYGTSANTSLNEADIEGLSNTTLATGYSGTFNFAAGNYKYFCIPTAFSNPILFRDANTNLAIAMAGPSEGYTISNGNGYYYQLVSVTNAYGVTLNYEVYRSKYTLGGTLEMNVT